MTTASSHATTTTSRSAAARARRTTSPTTSTSAGIRLPTKHRIFPRTPDGQSLAEPLIVSIDLSEIAFT